MAQITLSANETFTVGANSVATVTGGSGSEKLIVSATAIVTADQNVERTELSGKSTDYTYSIAGNVITVKLGSATVATITGGNGDKTIAFADGSTTLALTGLNTATLGGQAISTTGSTLTPAINTADKSTAGTSGTTNGGSTTTTGSTFTLTTGADTIQGTSADDAITGTIANVGAANSTGTTFQAGDVINGGLGTDTLTVSTTGGSAGSNAAVTFNGVEKIYLNGFNGTTQSVNLALADSSLTTVGLAASDGFTYTFTGLNKIVATELKNGSSSLNVTYNSSVVTGTADAQTVTVSNQTAGTLTTSGIETTNIVSSLLDNTLTLVDGSTKTVNISGAVKLGLTKQASVTKIDATSFTGALTVTAPSSTTATVIGGSGDDKITANAVVATGASISGGAGTDTLVLTDDTHVASTTLGAFYTGFEKLSVLNSAEATTARNQDVSLVSGITALNATLKNTSTNTGADTTQSITFTNLSSAVTSLDITGLTSAEAVNTTDEVVDTVVATRTTDTVTDAITLNLGTSTAASGATRTAVDGTENGIILDVTLSNENTINVVSKGGANFLGTLSAAQAATINVSGSQALSAASITAANLATLDASAMTADFQIAANTSTVASTITGGTGNDSLVGGTKADSISGGDGADTLSGAAGNDTLIGGAGADTLYGGANTDNLSGGDGDDAFIVSFTTDFTSLTVVETVSGGAGNDTLSFTEVGSITVAAADLVGLSSVENIKINGGINAGSITLTNAVYTANGVANLAIVDGDLTQGILTVDGSALTGTNAITVTANTTTLSDSLVGGAGDDTFVFAGTAGLEAGDTVNGGKGTDTIKVNASAAATLVMTAVTNIEKITTTGNGTGTITIDVLDANITSAVAATDTVAATPVGSLTFDGSSLTNGTGLVDYDGSLVTTVTKIQNLTGTAGADTLTGGSGNDIIFGGGANDTITGGIGLDSLSGGDGNDVFNIGASAEFVGLSTAETVSGGAGDDTIKVSVGAANITITANDLAAINSIKTISFVNADAQTASITLSDSVFTANGSTTLAVTNAGTGTNDGITVNASGLSAANSIQFTGASAAAANENVTGGAGNDTFTFATSGNGTALDANDSITGGAGTDTLVISTSTNALTAGTLTNVAGIEAISVTGSTGVGLITLADANFDTITKATISASALTAGALFVTAAAEDDSTFSITGGLGADSIIGGQLADTINGGLGADTINGGLEADVLSGGAGADIFVYTAVAQSNTSKSDSITDFVSGTDKLNVTLDYSSFSSSVTVSATVKTAAAGATAAQDGLSGSRGEAIYDSTNSNLYINYNADNLLTTADYRIAINPASTAANTIAEGDINFVITGGAAADTITAGGGADTIAGGAGADTINIGTGNDRLIIASNETGVITSTNIASPSALTSTEAFTWSSAPDVITGFGVGDTIQLYTTGTTAITLAGVVLTASGTIPSATTGGFAVVRGTQTNSTTFTASTTGADAALFWDADGTGAGGAYNGIILVGYAGGVTNDTVTTAGLFTAVA